MHVENEEQLTDLKPVHTSPSFSLLRTIISLALFIAADYLLFRSWGAVFLLVAVIFIHESGHFIAMKAFGYKGLNMTFVPFIGAYVSGEASHFSKSKKLIVLYAGPLPGIIIGLVLLVYYQVNLNEDYYLPAIAFLLLNVFNLLPVSPLDGGQIIETLFFKNNQVIQIIFLSVSLFVMLYLLYALKSWFLIFIAWLITRRIQLTVLVYKVRKELQLKNISYQFSYDELNDEQYALIRDVLISKSKSLSRKFTIGETSVNEHELISYVEKILMPYFDYELSRPQKAAFTLVYFLAFIIPILLWLNSKGPL